MANAEDEDQDPSDNDTPTEKENEGNVNGIDEDLAAAMKASTNHDDVTQDETQTQGALAPPATPAVVMSFETPKKEKQRKPMGSR